jgi:hypothetical protein
MDHPENSPQKSDARTRGVWCASLFSFLFVSLWGIAHVLGALKKKAKGKQPIPTTASRVRPGEKEKNRTARFAGRV